jgi:RNA polymerase sigma-70 factor (ECF subfamily)
MAYHSQVAVIELPEPVATTPMSDDKLVAATLSGDETAFAELFTRHKRMVAGIGGRFFQSREQIEEVIQMSFCQAYQSLRQYHGGGERSFAAWLKRIAVNTCLDELKKKTRRRESSFEDLTDGESDYLHDRAQAGWIAGAGPSAEQQTISRDLSGKLLARLRPEDRVALTLLYEEEWSVAEIGKLLDWSVPKVKMRTYQARNLLRNFIKRLR